MAGKRGPRLRDVTEVADFLARIIRETYRGDLDKDIAGRLAYMSNVLKGCLEAGELERRISDLEEQTGVKTR